MKFEFSVCINKEKFPKARFTEHKETLQALLERAHLLYPCHLTFIVKLNSSRRKKKNFRTSYLETDILLLYFLLLNQTSLFVSKAFKINLFSIQTSVFQVYRISRREVISICSAYMMLQSKNCLRNISERR